MRLILFFVCVGLWGGTALMAEREIRPPASEHLRYQYQVLRPPVGWIATNARDVNDRGVLVGWGQDHAGKHKAFVYNSGNYTLLLPAGWTRSQAYAINDSGTVVGWGVDDSDPALTYKGFVYNNGHYRSLLPPGWEFAAAYDINNSGMVVGCGRSSEGWRGFIYQEGAYTQLHPPGADDVYCDGSSSVFVNEQGVVVGAVVTAGGGAQTFVYSRGKYEVLPASGWPWTSPVAINDQGEIAGLLFDSVSDTFAGFSYHEGRFNELVPSGANDTVATDINDWGMVTGAAIAADTATAYAYWRGTYIELMPPGWVTSTAMGVNNLGVVVGNGSDGGIQQSFIATPKGTN